MALSGNYTLVSNIMKTNNPYDILGCNKYCSRTELDKRFKWTMSRVHPDKNSHPLATKAAQKVNLSRDLLLGSIGKDKMKIPTSSWSFTELVDMSNVKFNLLAVSLILAAWSVHITVFLLADEWSIVKSPVHRIPRTTPLTRIEYYVQSETSSSPPEEQVIKEFIISTVNSCKKHLMNDPWYGLFLYFYPNDPCTRGKVAVIYIALFFLIVRFFYRFFSKRKIA